MNLYRLVSVIIVAALLGSLFSCAEAEETTSRTPSPVPQAISVPTDTVKSQEPPPAPRRETPPPAPVSWNDFDRAARLYTTGRYDEALRLLERISDLKLSSRREGLVRFLGGAAAYHAGRLESVDRFLSGGSGPLESVSGYALYIRAQAHLDLGRYGEARALLEEYVRRHPGGPWVRQARLARVESLFYQGRAGQALDELEPLTRQDRDGRARLVRARIFEGQGRLAEARDSYKEAMDNSNRRDIRAEASHQYEELLAKALVNPGGQALKLALVRHLRQEWRLGEAVELADRLLAGDGDAEFRSALVSEKAKALFYSGKIESAIRYYESAGRPEQAKVDPYGTWMYARCLERLGRWPAAAEAYLLAARVTGLSSRRDKANFLAGDVFLRMGEVGQAEAAWKKISSQGLRKTYGDKVLWLRGFYDFRNRDWNGAARRFGTILEKGSDRDLRNGARYWLARSLWQAGNKKEARRHYRYLADNRWDYYYRFLAGQRLGRVKTRPPSAEPGFLLHVSPEGAPGAGYSILPVGSGPEAGVSPGAPGGLWDMVDRIRKLETIPLASSEVNDTIVRLRDLASAGALDLAEMEADRLRWLIGGKRGRLPSGRSKLGAAEAGRLKTDLAGLLGRILDFSGAYLSETGGYWKFVKLQYDYRQTLAARSEADEDMGLNRRCHPLAFPGAVLEAAKEFGLHPALILAVMRTESYYQPDIVSVANARGLMQLLPSTGRKISARLGHAFPNPEALFDVRTNIRFGSWYLAALLKEFDGQAALAVASYNAGPFNVKRWVQQSGAGSLDEFVETIPFDQTRHYVKKVLGTYFLYQLLFAGHAHGPEMGAPLDKTFRGQVDF
ncbi:MAG: transglycosylase SLT domain-containing protein [Proteobacteria bacterium]|nr:transglycosylase SLT domain-containing protein [Pseudomonadota bacterium]